MENNKEELFDYHMFYDEFKEGGYLPLRIDDEWLLENEKYLRENLYSFYITYVNSDKTTRSIKLLFKLYSEVILNTYNHFEGRGHYL